MKKFSIRRVLILSVLIAVFVASALLSAQKVHAVNYTTGVFIEPELPVAGRKPDFNVRVSGDMEISPVHTKEKVEWRLNGVPLGPNDVFEEGRTYELLVPLKCKEGYGIYKNDVRNVYLRTVFGGRLLDTGYSSDGETVFNGHYTASPGEIEVVDTVKVTGVKEPVPGEFPQKYADVEGADQCTLVWFEGKDDGTGHFQMKYDQAFEAGKEYFFHADCELIDGFRRFALDENGRSAVSGTLNGVNAKTVSMLTNNYCNARSVTVVYSFGTCLSNIESVSFSVTEPVVGASPSYRVVAGDPSSYGADVGEMNVPLLTWYETSSPSSADPANDRAMKESDVFVSGKYYYVTLVAVPKNGNFSLKYNSSAGDYDPVIAFINGSEAQRKANGSEPLNGSVLLISKLWSANTEIGAIDFDIPAPAAGDAPAFDADVPKGILIYTGYNTDYTHYGINWYDSTSGKYLGQSDSFVKGHNYRLGILYKAADGYTLAAKPVITAAGAAVHETGGNIDGYRQARFIFTDCPGPQIQSVSVTASDYEAGGSPRRSLSVGDSSYYRVDSSYTDDLFTNGFYWYDTTANARVTDRSFEGGHRYRLTVRLVPAEDSLSFATKADGTPNVKATVNGHTADAVYYWADPGAGKAIAVEYKFGWVPRSELDSVSVSVVPPAIGKSPDFHPSVFTAKAVVDTDCNEDGFYLGVRWVGDGVPLNPGDPFLPNVMYMATVRIKPVYGVDMDPSAEAELNGNKVYLRTDGDAFTLSYQFPKVTTLIHSAPVKVDPPSPGVKASFEGKALSAGYTVDRDYNKNGFIGGVRWLDMDAGQGTYLTKGQSFVKGHRYKVSLALSAYSGIEGYYFSDGCPVTVNSRSADVNALDSYPVTEHLLAECDFGACDKTVITKAEITVAPPVPGGTPSFVPTTGEGYFVHTGYASSGFTNGVRWTDVTESDRALAPGEKFVKGHIYKFSVALDASDGYEFDLVSVTYQPHPVSNAEATVNGFSASTRGVRASVKTGYVIAEYVFPARTAPGDANGDGDVTALDMVRLKKYLAAADPVTGKSHVTVASGADANGDGTVDANDLVRLKRYFAEYDPKTKKSSVSLG